MRIVGIDYGEKRIGLAVSDPLGIVAQGVGVVGSAEEVLGEIEKIDGVGEVVVGLPKTLRGEIGLQASKVLEFVKFLESRLSCQVTTWDERLTTAEADKFLISAGVSRAKRKKVIDKSAAAIILQSYLDHKQ